MKIKTMLTHLQDALGQEEWVKQNLLLRGTKSSSATHKTINLIVGYNGSPNSRAALDLTLWIAHQIRLVTPKQVTVHVVYVVEDSQTPRHFNNLAALTTNEQYSASRQSTPVDLSRPSSGVATLTRSTLELSSTRTAVCDASCHFNPESLSALEQADCILWQARCMTEEWRGSLDAHLRFGTVAGELKSVVESLHADLLVLGCDSSKHPLIRQLTSRFPCPVMGVPTHLAIAQNSVL